MQPDNETFEQGPIRPPNEARSLLLRVTRNCPWNHCLFCPVYKGRKFSLRTVDEIKKDIQIARNLADDILNLAQNMDPDGRISHQIVSTVFADSRYSDQHRQMTAWLFNQNGACFLQDADNLIMRTDDLVAVLDFLTTTFPEINRITTYSRSKTVTKKSIESLKRLRAAGLDRVHIGLETGYDPLLKLIKKGVTGDQQVEAGQKLRAAGMEVSEYVMPGLGGTEMWKEHAVETARVLNRINPHFIRLRSLRIPPRVPLYAKLQDGTFTMQTDDQAAEEIKVFIEHLDGITSTVTSDHMMNLLEEVSGKLPDDKEKMRQVVSAYQDLSDTDRLIYRTGRRGGAYRSTADLKKDRATYRKLKTLVDDIVAKSGPEGVEKFITEMVDQYI